MSPEQELAAVRAELEVQQRRTLLLARWILRLAETDNRAAREVIAEIGKEFPL